MQEQAKKDHELRPLRGVAPKKPGCPLRISAATGREKGRDQVDRSLESEGTPPGAGAERF